MIELLRGLRELKTAEQRHMLMLMLRAEVGDVGDGGLLRDILKWIAENPEQFKALVLIVISIFA